MHVIVRDIRGADELRACQVLQRRTWGITEDGYVVPVATMVGAQKMGGLVLGAFLDGEVAGFTFAFLGRLRDQLVLYSQLTAVDPDRQSAGIGRLLKLEQRRRAASMGVAAVVWAFDPLQASNAAFNLDILGATSSIYEVDLYGSRTDALNAGLATDRLMAEWPTSADLARIQLDWSDAVELVPTAPVGAGALRRPLEGRPEVPTAPRLRLEIPTSLAAVRAAGDLAQSWQLHVRHAFQAAFEAGYTAVAFVRGERPHYLLECR